MRKRTIYFETLRMSNSFSSRSCGLISFNKVLTGNILHVKEGSIRNYQKKFLLRNFDEPEMSEGTIVVENPW